ncbi:hypothetical protein F3J38_26440 [Pantoea sp. Acro-805]|uniref:Uncharacterized protein n=2 Tax=Candidatus Pantoea formicae TaxID=2608355 RepID=A0ABX0R2U3_9GAMM|nr:hypothetical protein [Pantoea formicae]
MRAAYRDTLCISPISGAHLKTENEIQELMHEAIGLAIRQVLHRGGTVSPHELIGALWRLKESGSDMAMREACSRAIRIFAAKLN